MIVLNNQTFDMENEIVMLPGDDFDSSGDKFVWSRPMVMMLIQEYKRVQHEFKDSTIKKKDLWRRIAHHVADKGYTNISDEMCDKKWRNLKKTFKEIYVGQGGSNFSNKTRWSYYNELKDIFSKDPNIVSAASVAVSTKPYLTTKKLLSSDGRGLKVEVMEVVGNLDEEYTEEVGTELTDGIDTDDIGYDNANVQQPPLWFAEFLHQYHADEERRTEMLSKMHADIIALEERKCSLLTMLIEKLGGSLSEVSAGKNDSVKA